MTTTSTTTSQNSAVQQLMKSSSSSSSSSNDTTTAEGVENRFLTLLVTQMQNQDPLNPMDNAQLTTQLAQINTVKGISTLNTTLDKLLSAYSDALSMQSSTLVGKNILSAGKNLSLGTSGAVGGVNLAKDAAQVTVSISNSQGVKVNELNLGAQSAGVNDFYWDGKDSNGNALAQGDYTFSVTAKDKTGAAVTTTPLQLGTVSALVRTSSGFQLELGDGSQLDYNAVQQIY